MWKQKMFPCCTVIEPDVGMDTKSETTVTGAPGSKPGPRLNLSRDPVTKSHANRLVILHPMLLREAKSLTRSIGQFKLCSFDYEFIWVRPTDSFLVLLH